MRQYVIDAQGNYITVEAIEMVAEAIATELGGEVIALEEEP